MTEELIKTVLTAIVLFAMLGPSVGFVVLAMHEMVLAFSRFGQAANVMRRRLLLGLVFQGLIGVCFFLSFEEIVPVGDQPVRAMVFVAGFACYLYTCGYAFLAWHLWASGSGRQARRRPVDPEGAVAVDEAQTVVAAALAALEAPIPSIRIIHVFGDDPVPLGDPPPSL